ncbi:SNF2 family N-terminal domain-containing protein [Lophiotrema nucula]|uniref:SNF2 family N-terminal domain-containing protein n=1 Tax=Lophiotrema nucula TaxID=690887 RepID=A0A6A5ZPX1_9PLEO|nr:SNF2 family N-terminal domain-containing protein [Lophiotrema nucula]
MQKRLHKSKSAAAARPPPLATPDPEAYLEAVQQRQAPAPEVESEEARLEREAEEEDRREAQEYQKQKKHFEGLRRKNNGDLSFKQDIEWMKIQSAEDARRKKRKRERALAQDANNDEDDFFLGDEPPNDAHHNESDVGEGPSNSKRQKPNLPRKEPKRLTLQEAELQAMNVALEAAGDLPIKKKRGMAMDDDPPAAASSSSRGRGRAKGSKASKSSKSKSGRGGNGNSLQKAPRKTKKNQREVANAAKQIGSLLGGNVFQDQAAADAPEQPQFTARNKKDALKQLIAGVSMENEKAAKGDAAILMSATKDFDGHGAAKPDGNSMWLVRGMKTSLKPYQLLGSAFMRRRENATEEPRGGLMADQMGLGKTLMMLANIVNGMPPRSAPVRTTLLVASPGLLTQWMSEIGVHTQNGLLRIIKYGTGNRLESNQTYEIFRGHDIVLTTYAEVMKSYPKNEPPIQCQTADQKLAWWKKTYEEQRGVLHRMQWLRVVLDEAQAIKNYASRTSIACRALMAEHRWAVSGTPILNTLVELYPYFKFLGVPHTGSLKIFKHNYCDSTSTEHTERLLVRLNQFMIRRTHADMMFGAPILKLPRADQTIYWCNFNEVERNIYKIVESRFIDKLNQWARSNELEKSYSNAFVMFLRLRQLTAHILLLQFVMRDLLEREDIERIRQVISNAEGKGVAGQTIKVMRAQLRTQGEEEKKKKQINRRGQASNANESAENEEADEDEEVDEEFPAFPAQVDFSGLDTGKKFGTDFDFKPYLQSLKSGEHWDKVKEKARCKACGRHPVNPWLTGCHHLVCSGCYEYLHLQEAEQGREGMICPCGERFTYAHPCQVDGEFDSQEFVQGPSAGTRGKKKQQRARPEQENIREDWLSLNGEGVLPSAKTIGIKAQILNWIGENPDVKIIVYTQFLAMIRILGKVCEEEGWATEQYHGNMSFTARDKAIANFAKNPHIRVMLASLRCGGLGLNLTMASRVILIDPWWNEASEQQAFCRVFRIGQKETTFMTRFCVRDTIDERLIKMQERKKKEIEEVMDDDGTRVKKMSIRDLMKLFGPVEDDSHGRPFIMVENEGNRNPFFADVDHEGYADEI